MVYDMAFSKRLEKIKNARSLNDIVSIVDDIAFEFKNSKAVVDKLIQSLSAEITFDSRDAGSGRRRVVKVKDEGFVAPNVKELQKHVGVIHKLYDNVLELDAAEALVKQAFAGNKKQKAALEAIRDLKKDIDDSLNDAFDTLNEIANKHMPSQMTELVDGLTKYLIDTLDVGAYKNIFRNVYVVPDTTDKHLFQFCAYIGIESLKNTSGYVFDQYYVVLTGVISNSGTASYFLNSFPDFKAPGRYPIGQSVADVSAARKRLGMLLAHNSLVLDLDKLPLPIDDQRAANVGITNLSGVEKATVKDDELTVILAPTIKTDNAVQKVVIEILGRLNAVVGTRKSSKVFTYKVGTVKGQKAVKFALVSNVGGKGNFNLGQLNEVADMLNLTPKQREALRFALQS